MSQSSRDPEPETHAPGRPAEYDESRTVRVPVMVTPSDKARLDELAADLKEKDRRHGSVSTVAYYAIRKLLYGDKIPSGIK